MRLKQYIYLPTWFVRARFFGSRRPLQTVLFISDRCNLHCRHCSVVNKENPVDMSYEAVRRHLQSSYAAGSRFVDFEGGETMLWRDNDRDINDLIDLAKSIGFFSATITTNAQLPFSGCRADSIWVSMDGLHDFHDAMRGPGTFDKLEKNIAIAGHRCLNVNMVICKLNHANVADTLEYVKNSPYINAVSFNFYTPFPGVEDLSVDDDVRSRIIDEIIEFKKRKYPILNSISGLKRMKHNDFKRHCWVTDFVYPDGTRDLCAGLKLGICDRCGLCMAGEMSALFNFKPDTIFAGLKLRMS